MTEKQQLDDEMKAQTGGIYSSKSHDVKTGTIETLTLDREQQLDDVASLTKDEKEKYVISMVLYV